MSKYAQLSAVSQLKYKGLKNAHPELPEILGIWQTNALPLGPTDGSGPGRAAAAAIFLVGCRFNHSCVPNVSHCWEESLQVERFHAVIDIKAGTELCICYSNPILSREKRRQGLQVFGFTCGCESCSLDEVMSRVRDSKLAVISEYIDLIPYILNQPQLLRESAVSAIELLKELGIQIQRGSLAYDVFQCCVAWNDIVNAKLWAEAARKAYTIDGGDSSEAQRMAKFVVRPSLHPATRMMGQTAVVGPPSSDV